MMQVNLNDNPRNEDDHQMNVIAWAETAALKWPELARLYHIPNERKCTPAQGMRLKRMGVKPGVSDLCLPVPRGKYHGLYIEMKSPGGRETKEQKDWRDFLNAQGYYAVLCEGYNAASERLVWYMNLGEFYADI